MSAPKARERRHRRTEIETRNLAPVQDVVRDYRVIEDGAYAHNLQEQEIEYHYSQNVNMRRTVQDDIRAAKELQDEEDRKAKIRTLDEEDEVKQMDEELAEIIQEQIFSEVAMQEREKKEWEEEDKELALLMEEKERRKAIEYARRNEERDFHLAKQMERVGVTSPESDDGRRMRVMSDKELARRLQKEEHLKAERDERQKKELQSAVELQDEELAKYIHEKDIEKAENIYRKSKKQMKGKHRNEPLYYDDNFDPPDYHAAATDHQSDHSNGCRQHKDEHRHGHRDHRNRHSHHHDQPRHSREGNHEDRSRRYPPPYEDREQNHSGQRRSNNRRPQSEHKPNRPPPPQFESSHNTEVKLPLDDSQVRSRERDRHATRRSSDQDLTHSHERNYHREHRHGKGHSERHRNAREVADPPSYKPQSQRGHKSARDPHDQGRRHRDDLQYSEDMVRLPEDQNASPNNNLSRKKRKSKSECKQQ